MTLRRMQTGHNKDNLSFVFCLLVLIALLCLLKGIKEAKKSEKSNCSFADVLQDPVVRANLLLC